MKRYCTSRLVRRLKDSRGANIVEMALVLPLLFLLTFSIVDFASMFYAYLALENGVTRPDELWNTEGGEWQFGRKAIHDVEPRESATTSEISE